MIDLSTVVVFALAGLLLALTPGPAVMYILARGIGQGRQAALNSALGVETGTLVHVIAASLGLSAIVMSSAVAFTMVKIGGAIYLVYLGIRTLLERQPVAEPERVAPASMRRIFGQGVIVQVLNPKVALFFLAFLPQFVDTQAGHVTMQTLVLGLIFTLVALVVDWSYALLAGVVGGRLRRNVRLASRQRWFAGGVYLALGVSTLFASADAKSGK